MKRNFIKLVNNGEDVAKKNAEPKYDTFVTPSFIPLRKMYEATDVMEEMQSGKTSEKQAFDMLMDMVVDIYEKQFTRDDVLDRLHSPDAMEELQQQVQFVSEGQMDDERKKELKKML